MSKVLLWVAASCHRVVIVRGARGFEASTALLCFLDACDLKFVAVVAISQLARPEACCGYLVKPSLSFLGSFVSLEQL